MTFDREVTRASTCVLGYYKFYNVQKLVYLSHLICYILVSNVSIYYFTLSKWRHPYSTCHEKRQFDVCGWVGYCVNNHIHNGVHWHSMNFGSDYGTAYKFLSNTNFLSP